MLFIGILLPPEHLEVLEENLDWEDIQWSEKQIGDPLEKAAMKGIDWNYKSKEKAIPNTRVGSSVELKWNLCCSVPLLKIIFRTGRMVAVASNVILTLSLKTNRRENVTFLRNIILDDRVPANELKFLLRSLNNLGSLLEKSDRLKEV
ncbi:hypothetical protein Tco_1226742 [Tanacetum coccineum]